MLSLSENCLSNIKTLLITVYMKTKPLLSNAKLFQNVFYITEQNIKYVSNKLSQSWPHDGNKNNLKLVKKLNKETKRGLYNSTVAK